MANVNGIGWYAGWTPDSQPATVTNSSNGSSPDTSFSAQLTASLSATARNTAAAPTTVPSVGSLPLALNNPTASAHSPSSSDATTSEADAYWAMQPPEVQSLRNMTDPAERESAALDLANKGFTIDYQTMVLGWDPLNVMSIRQFYGYTWVPSMLQDPVSGMPGSNLPGLPVYDPNSPPAGSIQVSTNFAMGKTVPSWESYNAVTGPDGSSNQVKTST